MRIKTTAILLLVTVSLLSLSGCVSGEDEAVTSAIVAIDAIGEVTIDSLLSIENAESLYSNLLENQKLSVTNYAALQQARNEFNVLAVTKAIYEIASLEQITIDHALTIRAAEAAFEALSDEQKSTIENYAILRKALPIITFIETGTSVSNGWDYFVFSQENMTIEKVGEPNFLHDADKYHILMEAVIKNIETLHKQLSLPNSLYADKMVKTTISDGIQTQTFDNVRVSWSYDPANIGLAILYEFIPSD